MRSSLIYVTAGLVVFKVVQSRADHTWEEKMRQRSRRGVNGALRSALNQTSFPQIFISSCLAFPLG